MLFLLLIFQICKTFRCKIRKFTMSNTFLGTFLLTLIKKNFIIIHKLINRFSSICIAHSNRTPFRGFGEYSAVLLEIFGYYDRPGPTMLPNLSASIQLVFVTVSSGFFCSKKKGDSYVNRQKDSQPSRRFSHGKTSGRKFSQNGAKAFWGKPLLSLDIGQHTTKLVFGTVSKLGIIDIRRTVSVPTPAGALEKGRILDPEKLAVQIQTVLSGEKSPRHVLCTLETPEIITREIFLPFGTQAQMQGMLEYEIQQYMPVDLSGYILQSRILDISEANDTKRVRFLSTAVPKDLAQSYFDLIQRLNLKASVLDIQSNSICKLFLSKMAIEKSNGSGAVAVVDLGYSHINIVIIENGTYQFNRYIELGSVNIDENLKRILKYPQEKIEQCKRIGFDLNPASSAPVSPLSPESEQAVRESNLIKNAVDSWAEELERVFKYYFTRSSGKSIEKILLHGGGSLIPGLSVYLTRFLNIPAEPVPALCCIRTQENPSWQSAPYLTAVGALIRC